jgi:type IV pilus assembly protein PilV
VKSHRTMPSRAKRSRGFTLLEVMVSVLVVAIGLLGLAKMQALAVSSSQVSGSRSMVAMQATSLASAMHSGRGYWAVTTNAPASCLITGNTIDSGCGSLATAATCDTSGATCSDAQLAAFDLKTWAQNMTNQFASHKTTVACTSSATTPVSCTIKVVWTEKTVAAVNQAAAAASVAASTDQTYILHVEP